MIPPDPVASLARLQAYIRPDAPGAEAREPWELPAFETYEDLKAWLKEAVLQARVYEAFPDGRWTIELLLKEQAPVSPRYLQL